MSRNKELLRKYFNGELSEEEKKLFTEIAAKDESFRRQMIHGLELDVIIDDHYNKDDKDSKAPQSSKNKIYKIISISAAAIVLISFSLWLFRQDKQIIQNQAYNQFLFEQYYSPIKPMELRSISEHILDRDSLLSMYNSGNYLEIYESKKNNNNLYQKNDINALLLGISCIENNDDSLALSMFSYISSESKYFPTANYYKGLIYLRSADFDKALLCFKESKESLYYMESANELQKKIQELINKP